ncbi:MAG: right-handed parallel beta-helix repeat-containing protein, partial [Planctomycetota bacterium]
MCSIGAAVALAALGDTIRIAPGTYVENVALPFDLDLIGTGGAAVTFVDGGALGSVITIPAAVTVTIEGLTIQNGLAERGAGILSDGALTLRNSTITDNHTPGAGAANQGGGGIGTSGPGVTSDLVVEQSVIRDNSVLGSGFGYGGGILFASGSLRISDSIVHGNSVAGGFDARGAGISTTGDASVEITRTELFENFGGISLNLAGFSSFLV